MYTLSTIITKMHKHMFWMLFVAFLLYCFNCLLETDCWENSTDSEGIDFEIQTDQ
jgi:hypothetical protein